jgi:putative RNA 2'-phosphotransferase
VSAVLEALKSLGLTCNLERLQEVVATNDKQRFELSPDGAQIRARQGHSLPIAHEWPKVAPPELLYHGTSERFLPDIMNEGLKRMRRHHVHLSGDVPTARAVAARRSSPVVLAIAAREMETRGFSFFMTANGVWLTEHVPPDYISLLS